MESLNAYCGLTCDTCPIHLATLEKDLSRQLKMRELIVQQCHTLYNMDLQLEDISDCDGCQAKTGRLFSGCLNCEIRKCAGNKYIDSCAFCTDYPCAILEKHFMIDSGAKIKLDEIWRNYQSGKRIHSDKLNPE